MIVIHFVGYSSILFDFISQMQFQRCARTDKGVSAAGQVVSIKISPKYRNYILIYNIETPIFTWNSMIYSTNTTVIMYTRKTH